MKAACIRRHCKKATHGPEDAELTMLAWTHLNFIPPLRFLKLKNVAAQPPQFLKLSTLHNVQLRFANKWSSTI